MFGAFCNRASCEWRAESPFADSLAALVAVDAHVRDEHGRRPADLEPTGIDGLARVPFEGDGRDDVARTYVTRLSGIVL